MLIPDEIRKCVAFIGLRLANGDYLVAGSTFFLGRGESGEKADFAYAVTARHVIDSIRATGVDEVWLRLNEKDGQAQWFSTRLSDWFSHSTDTSIDVAILKITMSASLDHLVYPYSLCIDKNKLEEHEVSLGDEVFITGLFKHHYGSRRNIPIVRVGNLACMPEEKILTNKFGEMDAYLVEARSIGGLSGSPAFLNLGVVRILKGELKFSKSGSKHLLLGLVHGHYDVEGSDINSAKLQDDIAKSDSNRVNTGIAMIVPFHSIDSVVTAFEERANKLLQATRGTYAPEQ